MTQFIGGLSFTDSGRLQTLNGTAGVPAGATFIGGWAVRGSDGFPYVQNMTATAVPAAAVLIGGIAHNQDGRRYVTTQATTAKDVAIGGQKVRQDGALRVSTSAVATSDVFLAGWAVAQTGRSRVSIT